MQIKYTAFYCICSYCLLLFFLSCRCPPHKQNHIHIPMQSSAMPRSTLHSDSDGYTYMCTQLCCKYSGILCCLCNKIILHLMILVSFIQSFNTTIYYSSTTYPIEFILVYYTVPCHHYIHNHSNQISYQLEPCHQILPILYWNQP